MSSWTNRIQSIETHSGFKNQIDAPLNETGRKQAIRLGKALSYSPMIQEQYQTTSTSRATATAAPASVVHSNLLRAYETASIATTMLESMIQQPNLQLTSDDDETIRFANDTSLEMRTTESQIINDGVIKPEKNNDNQYDIRLQSLSTLAEVDLGPLNEGKSSTIAKADMLKTYTSWTMGDIDCTLGGSGESGRDILTRAASSLASLTNIALENGRTTVNGSSNSTSSSVIAVSHSTYLNLILALVLDIPLVQAATLEQKSCCINVLDVSLLETRDVNSKSNLFSNDLNPTVSQDFQLKIPRVDVVRMNENQHLTGLV